MKWKSISPWFALVFNVCVAAWFVYQGDALAAAIWGAVSGALFSVLMSRRIWKIDNQTASDLWIEFWGRGVGEKAANARFSVWICSIISFIFCVVRVRARDHSSHSGDCRRRVRDSGSFGMAAASHDSTIRRIS